MKTSSWTPSAVALAFALAAWTAGCASTHSDQGTDSTTHWLERCDSDDDCGGLSCLCGTCSTSCEGDGGCSQFGAAARCGTPASCAAPAPMCIDPEREAAPAAAVQSGTPAGTAPGPTAVPAAGSGMEPEVDARVTDCQGVGFLRGGGRSHQPCVDDCRLNLSLTRSTPDGGGPCEGELQATVSVQMIDDSSRDHTATLTAPAWDTFVKLSSELSKSGPRAGFCPGCGDGDRAWLIVPGIDQFDADISYALGSPPSELFETDAFVQNVLDQVDACSGPLIAECKDTTPAVNPDDPGTPLCTIGYDRADGGAAARCAFAPDIADPCRALVKCLCSSPGLLPGPTDPQGCEDSWLTARGAITFTDFCTQGQSEITRPLAEAVSGFASAYGDTASATPECDPVLAYY